MLKAEVLDLIQKTDFQTSQRVDLHNCDREAIHLFNTVQPHGCLIAYSNQGIIIQISENSEAILGISPTKALGQSLNQVLGHECGSYVRAQEEKPVYQHNFSLTLPTKNNEALNAVLHLNEGFWVLEMEPRRGPQADLSISEFSGLLQELRAAKDLEQLYNKVAAQLQQMLGFDRVMVYKFADDDSGQVVAEAVRSGLEPFLGLHYPATDIPKQARLLYLHSEARSIADVAAAPVPLTPALNPVTSRPLNFANAVLRSVSPIHVEYLVNMGVRASMSISIVVEGRLWGLFACHHYEPRVIQFPVRNAAAVLTKNFSGMLQERLSRQAEQYIAQMRRVQTQIFERFKYEDDFVHSLIGEKPSIQDLVTCGGCVIMSESVYYALGEVPSRQQVNDLISWLQQNQAATEVFSTDRLPLEYAPAQEFAQCGAGLLAIAISRVQGDYILWFRPEKIETVTWAGKPHKVLVPSENGSEARLSPRKSFAAWSEEVRHKSEPWKLVELQIARDMRSILVDIVMRVAGELKLRADILSRVNRELEASNNELDSFAYIASHDLKEPLRGIHNYSQFLIEDYQDVLDEDGKQKLHTLMRLSGRMSALLDSLLQYSRVGRIELHVEETNLNKLVQEVLYDLQGVLEENNTVEIAENLPVVTCDPLRIGEVIQNLIVNGLKYNESVQKRIKIGSSPGQPYNQPDSHVIWVQDNGIGIDTEHHDAVFTIFRRLHARNAYGGGTGVGLTIVKKVIERHGGQIWIDSTPGQGTTFYFTLPA